ncbi:YggT family protein [Vogesella indigofera]|uniref:YggT family protein n=1 Tax=Vogesella indigofera TaxID=45465 RepID=UPI003F425DEB
MMLLETLQFLIKTISELFVLVLLMRFYLQVARAPFKHPLTQFVIAVSNFAVLPLRRWIPAWRSYDTATMVLAWVVSLLALISILLLNPLPYDLLHPQSWLSLTLLALLDVFRLSLYLLMGAVFVLAILSWVNPYNGLRPVLEALTRPYLRPFQRAVIGGVDLSPLVLLLVIQVILMLPVRMLEMSFLMQLKMAV